MWKWEEIQKLLWQKCLKSILPEIDKGKQTH